MEDHNAVLACDSAANLGSFQTRLAIDVFDYYPDSTGDGGYLRLAGWVYCYGINRGDAAVPRLRIGIEGHRSSQKPILLTLNVPRPDVVKVYHDAPEMCGFDYVIPVLTSCKSVLISIMHHHTVVHHQKLSVESLNAVRVPYKSPQDHVINVRFYTDYPVCNFRCPYCVAGHGNNTTERERWDEEMFHKYDKIMDNLGKLDMRINVRPGVAGEFFLSEKLMDGAVRLAAAENVQSINLITNLSRPLTFYERFLSRTGTTKVALVASYHPTEVTDPDEWFEKAVWMNSALDFAVILVGYPPIIDQLEALKFKLNSLGLTVFVQGFIGSYQGRAYPQAYSPAHKEVLRKICYSRHDYEFFVEARKPGLCYAGFNSFYVDMTGVVRPCGVGGWPWPFMGNLLEEPTVALCPAPHPCISSTCLCDTEYINTAIFRQYYRFTGLNQHKFEYKFKHLAATWPAIDEWEIAYC